MADRTYSTSLSILDNNDVATLYATTRNHALKDEVLSRFEAMICSICMKHKGRADMDDMLQEGRIALIQALDEYDPSEFNFSTIAYIYVSGKVRHFLRDKANTIRMPAWVQDHYRREELARAALEATFHREPTDEEVARAMKISVARLQAIHENSPHFYRFQDIDFYKRRENSKMRQYTPDKLISDVFGSSKEQDDGFVDNDERMYLRTASVTALMHAHRIGIIEARKLKDLVSR